MPSVTVQGAPSSVYLSASHSDQEWRLQEQLVALFETNLQGIDTPIAFSPMDVRDIIGSTENVDVVYAAAENTSKYLSFVEVRDRNTKVGRQYVQEIMGKRKSIDIQSCTIVSTKGFTKDAVDLARHQGIKLRLLTPETPDAISFFKGQSLPFRMILPPILARCILFADHNGVEKHRIIEGRDLDSFTVLSPTDEGDKYLACPLSRLADLECFTLPSFAPGGSVTSVPAYLATIPQDGFLHRAEPIVISYNTPRWYDSIDGTLTPITRISFCILAGTFYIEAPIHQRYKYIDAFSTDVIARSVLARFHRDEVLYNVNLTAYVAEQRGGMQYIRMSLFFGKVPHKGSSSQPKA